DEVSRTSRLKTRRSPTWTDAPKLGSARPSLRNTRYVVPGAGGGDVCARAFTATQASAAAASARNGARKVIAKAPCGKTVDGSWIGCARSVADRKFSPCFQTKSSHRPIVVQLRTALRLRSDAGLLESSGQ